MARYFAHYWSNDTWRWNASPDREPCDHIAGNMFRKRGVNHGDFIYIVTVERGQLLVSGRMRVGQIIAQEQAEELLGQGELWEAEDHIIASPGTGTPMSFDRIVPLEIVRSLRCVTGEGEKGLMFKTETELDQQTLRGLRELSRESARLLDTCLDETPIGPPAPTDADFEPDHVEDERSRRMRGVVNRLGQGEFRRTLMRAYEGRCAISGYDVEQTLQAAHILPYLGRSTNHAANGLLLRADLHNLFDCWRLAINPKDLTVCISSELLTSPYGEFAGRMIFTPADESMRPNREALKRHHEGFLNWEDARNGFTDEELDVARGSTEFYTTAELLQYLQSL